MRILFVLALAAFITPKRLSGAVRWTEILGRKISYRGDGFLEIWHVGINHTLFVLDSESSDLIFSCLRYSESVHEDLIAYYTATQR